jgi:hypothetical protein
MGNDPSLDQRHQTQKHERSEGGHQQQGRTG